jgi:outer membrane protein TolC
MASRVDRVARLIGLIGVVGFLVTAFTPLAHRLNLATAVPAELVPSDAIVVLGAWVSPSGTLSSESLRRTNHGIALYRRGLAPTLVLLGGSASGGPSEADARAEQARLGWESTVLSALEECENAMSTFVREQERRAALTEAVSQARRAVELARTQYTEGLADFQTVLVAERALADLDDQLAVSDAAITTNLVTLYKALGGGWEGDDPVTNVSD